ncbi:MAG: hypothetical protein RL722_1889 [Pseudomonadota bacterium]|jgi:thimet oligopeptidase
MKSKTEVRPAGSRWLAALVLAALSQAGLYTPALAAGLPGPAWRNPASPEALAQDCRRGLAQAGAELARLEKRAPDGQWLAAYDRLGELIEDRSGPYDLMTAVAPDKAIRDAAQDCQLKWQAFFSALGQNTRLYAAARRIKPADEIDAGYLSSILEGFEDGGAALQGAKRARAKQINDELAALEQKFDANVREAKVQVTFTEAELAGVPEAVWSKAPKDEQGRRLLGLDYPTYGPVMQLATDGAARQRLWTAKQNEGGAANLELLKRIVTLRTEYAGLFGKPSYADFVLQRRMAASAPKANAFLDSVQQAVEVRERQEIEELRRAKADHLGQPLEGVKLERWDVSFYTERVRQARYSVDQEAFRPYLPPEASLEVVMKLVETLMGVRYERVAGAPAWHPDVRAYTVRDVASGKALGALYVDLYPREGKYNHAAVWPFRGSAPGRGRTSQAALVVNFNRQGLSLDEFETLLHEFGHSVHTNLSATRYVGQAGTSVKRDFVEAPSQMLEEWTFDPKVLALFQQVCPSCKPVPADLLAKATEAHHYGKGVFAARQRLYAAYDMALYNGQAADPMALWARMEGATPLGHVAGTMFPAGFSHIASGYAAGYYGYLWSLVLAKDMATAYGGNLLDPAIGQRYRRTVLAQGAQRDPGLLVRDFLGREFSPKAFFDDLKR